jgi:hypothetical protein
MGKEILVVSHERSGTHFLINSIGVNFGYSVHCHNVTTRDYLTDRRAGIYKSHHQYEFYKNDWEQVLNKFHVVYIIRDGRDVLNSSWHYQRGSGAPAFPNISNFGTWMREDPTKYRFDSDYSIITSHNMAERWKTHVEGWDKAEGVLRVRYESLLHNFDETLSEIEEHTGLKRIDTKQPKLTEYVSVSPRKGVSGDWENYFSHKDIDYFDNICKDTMKRLGYM